MSKAGMSAAAMYAGGTSFILCTNRRYVRCGHACYQRVKPSLENTPKLWREGHHQHSVTRSAQSHGQHLAATEPRESCFMINIWHLETRPAELLLSLMSRALCLRRCGLQGPHAVIATVLC